ncbi:37 kDa salivary gland allergen Aed a 2-like [Uranotaenia lowii]|uniref:37 kDa salivary gland allergen Aed a 2-like n=1 Tax=Uranotaenia lowii TaxID=190385 RepID=UPI00247894F8|nr:37 kDa salivary gland allergen Aed a 2-like [Uranotaenia lowii]
MFWGTLIILGCAMIHEISCWRPKNIEFTAFIKSRCRENELKDLDSTEARSTKYSELSKNEHTQGCYIACVLNRTGIYSKSSNPHNENRILKQYNRYKKYNLGVTENDANEAYAALQQLGVPQEDNCVSVTEKLKTLDEKSKNTIIGTLWGGEDKKENRVAVYQHLGGAIKQVGQSVIEYCAHRYYPNVTVADICEENDEHKNNFDFARLIDCIYTLFRYQNKYWIVRPEELARDYEAIGQQGDVLTAALQKCLNDEPKDVDEIWRPSYLHECLVSNKEIAIHYEKALIYRDSRTLDYSKPILEMWTYNDEKAKEHATKVGTCANL